MDYQSKIIVDANKALKDLERLSKVLQANDKHMNLLNKSSQALNDSLKKNANSTGKLTTQIKHLTEATKKTSNNVKLLNTQVKILSTATKNNTINIKKLSATTKLLNTSMKNTAASMKQLNSSMKVNNANIKKNSAEVLKLSKSMNTFSIATNKSATSMTKLTSQTRMLSANVKRNSSSLNKLRTGMNTLNSSVSKTATALSVFNRNSMQINANINANTAALNKFTKQMAVLGTTINANTAAMSRYSRTTTVATVSQAGFGKSLSVTNAFLRSQLILFRAVMLAATGYMALKLYIEFNRTAESVDLMNKKLVTFTDDAQAIDRVKESAFKAGVALDDMGKIITRFAVTTQNAFSTDTLVKWTEGLVMSARAVGTTTMEMNNALVQLSQSFSAGYLMGDEYRSISENLPLFKLALREVADEAGYANKALKTLSSERKIDIELMTKALDKLAADTVNYAFALDTVDAAVGRLSLGWEVFANAIADSRGIKDALNYMAGLFANLANDGATMRAFANNFKDMNDSVVQLSEFLLDQYDTLGLLIDEWSRFFTVLGEGNAIGFLLQNIKEFILFAEEAFYQMPTNIEAAMSIIGVKVARSVEEWGITFDILGVYWQRVMDYLSSSLDHTAADISSAFLGIFDGITESISRQMKGIAAILNKFSATESMGKSFDGASKSLSEMVNKQKTFAEIDAEISANYNKKKAATDAELVALNLKIETGKEITSQMESDILKKRQERIDEFNHNRKMNADLRKADRSTVIQPDLPSAEKPGLAKKDREDKKAITAYNNAVNKAQKDLYKFYETQKEVNQEINELKNPFSTKYDSSGENEKLQEQLEKLSAARKYNQMTEIDYQNAVKKTRNEIEELIALKQDEKLNELARSYDEVKSAAYDFEEAQSNINDLLDAGKISTNAAEKAMYEYGRALDIAKAKSGEMNEGDQFYKGMQSGLYDFANNNKTVFEEMEELTTRSFSSMTDELTEFVTTGKADFKGLVDSIVKDLTRIAIQKSITEPLANAMFGGSSSSGGGMGGLLGGLIGGISGIGGGSLGVGGMGPPTPGIFQADGGVWQNGKVQAFANGGIVSSPTLFPMADGAGLMGEAGAEAIMPLKRGKNGKLGVVSTGNEQNITININVSGTEGNPEAIRRSAGQVAQAAGNATQRAMRRNG